MPLCIYLKQCFGGCTGISFIDSTCLHVCHNRRIKQQRVFKGIAARGKTSVDWFFGFKLLSRKRAIIETVIDQLKNISQIEHSRHRSPINATINIICGLIAYCHQPKKPSLHMDGLYILLLIPNSRYLLVLQVFQPCQRPRQQLQSF